MNVTIIGVDQATPATDPAATVVVVDVIRAFTTACGAMAAGATSITCVESLDAARRLRDAADGAVLMGEERGRRPEGFDLGNETDGPSAELMAGRPVVQRTSNGTRGLVRAGGAGRLLALAAVNVGATAAWIDHHAPSVPVTVVTTGLTSEDLVVAHHLAALLAGELVDPHTTAIAIREAFAEHLAFFTRARPDVEITTFRADVDRCALVDIYPFALVATASTGAHPVLRAESPDGTSWSPGATDRAIHQRRRDDVSR